MPGDRQSTSLRSQHAAADVPTEVELELTLGERRMRVVRHPAHERPKRRGSGTPTEPAGVRLEERRAAGWQTVSTRIDETAQVTGVELPEHEAELRLLTRGALMPTQAELDTNPRSASVRLRAAERTRTPRSTKGTVR